MSELYIRKSMDIQSSAQNIWNILTDPKLNKQWATEFMEGIYVESDWQVGSRVDWMEGNGDVFMQGMVTRVEANKVLEITFYKMDEETLSKEDLGEEDLGDYKEIYELEEDTEEGETTLHIVAGDYGLEGAEYYDDINEGWDKALLKIKKMAEK